MNLNLINFASSNAKSDVRSYVFADREYSLISRQRKYERSDQSIFFFFLMNFFGYHLYVDPISVLFCMFVFIKNKHVQEIQTSEYNT